MENVNELIKKAGEMTKPGFKMQQAEAERIIAAHSAADSQALAHQLYSSEVYQARMIAVLIFELTVSGSAETFAFLKNTVSKDGNWRVQEMLARAFDRFCKDVGYEKALPTIREWLSDANPNTRRAVTEGLRIWVQRDYFKKHPEVAISFLSALRADSSEYVRKSVGNAIRDISRTHADLVRAELATWNTTDKKIAFTYKLANRFLS